MLLNMDGQKITFGNTCFYIGQEIIAIAGSDYEGLSGVITEIHTGKQCETNNETAEIYCDFALPGNNSLKARIEKRFSLFIEDIELDGVNMSPEMIEPKGTYQINPMAQPFYVLTYYIDTSDESDTHVLGVSASIDALKEKKSAHIEAHPRFVSTDIFVSGDFCVCEYDVRSVPDDGKRHVWKAENNDEFYSYVISKIEYVLPNNIEK